VAVGGALGVVILRRGLVVPQVLAAVAGMEAVVGVIVLPLLGAGVLGANSRAGAGATLLSLLLVGLLYLVSYEAVWRFMNPGGTLAEEDAASRRAFLKNAALLGGGVALGIGSFRWLAGRLEPPPVPAVASLEASRTTAAVAAAGSLADALAAG